jgi:DNA-binding transcriptional ArsR family regulator
MYDGGVSLIDLPALRGNPFDNRPIESSRAQDLVGRKEILHRWREHIHSGSPRMILLVGESGSGRTSMINAISSQTPKKYIGQFLSEEGDQAKLVLHEILTHFGTFQSISTMNQLSQKLISLLDEDKGPLPIIALDYPPQIIDINSFLSRICPILSRLRTMVIVSVTESQYLEIDNEIRNLFDEPDRLENFTKIEIQEMVNNRMRLKSKEKWIINSQILNSIYGKTGGNPRDTITILKRLVDEKRDLGYQGTLENLMSFHSPKTPLDEEIVYARNNIEEVHQSEISVPVTVDNNLENDDLIDEEPSDLWDFDEEVSLSAESLYDDDNDPTDEEKPIWSDNFPEIENDLVDEETNIIEEDDIGNETELFMTPGTEPPDSPTESFSSTKNKGFGFLRKRLQKTTSSMENDITPNIPITYADEEPPQSTLDNYVSQETPEIQNMDEINEPIVSEARMDQNIHSIDYDIIEISVEGAEWSVEPSYQSTVPDLKPKSNVQNNPPLSIENYPNEENIVQESAIEESIFEEPEIQDAVELIESIPIYPTEKNNTMINDLTTNKSRFSPIWEEDNELDVNRFYSLSDAERMILEVASTREISPSDDELQARLEVGRPRLSQLYNSLQKSGMLSVRKQGRTRLFKLSDAAANEF